MAASKLRSCLLWTRIVGTLRSNPCFFKHENLCRYRRIPIAKSGSGNIVQACSFSSSSTPRLNAKSTEDSSVSGGNNTPTVKPGDNFMNEMMKNYEHGKHFLAKMMGEDPETFTDKDVEEAIKYLMPSGLFAKDARPVFKHPALLYPPSKEDLFDKDGRPLQPGFYTGQIVLNDLLYEIFQQVDILKKDIQIQEETRIKQLGMSDQKLSDVLPQQSRDSSDIIWLSQEKLQKMLGVPINEREYRMVVSRLTELAGFENAYLIEDFLRKFYGRQLDEGTNYQPDPLDENGCGHAFGYRKSSVAEVWLKRGTGVITVNDRSFVEYFNQIQHRHQIAYPFLVVGELGNFDATCNVIGGGFTGQSGAIRVAIARAFLSFSEDYRPKLEEANLLEIDNRKVERKKPGQKKARKKFAWVAR